MPDAGALPRTVGLLGAGVIGGGWAARFVLAGTDVRLYDPSPAAAEGAQAAIDRARHVWGRLTSVPLPAEGLLTLVSSVAEAVQGAQLVQESAPEREELKAGLLAQASRAADPEAIIASSTSGLLPSRLAAGMEGPGRFVVGHPFNPVYLLPLVEVCGCPATTADTVARASAIYTSIGMRPLVVRREIDGFVADRLLEALWREALWLVHEDVATVQEVDDAIVYGAGLRWAAMGTFLTYRLAGGEAGMRHFMAQFGPALKLPWTKLTNVPDLDDALLDKIVAQSDAQAAGRSIEDLIRIRDDCLIAILRGLRDEGFAAGDALAQAEHALLARAGVEPPGLGDAVATPTATASATVTATVTASVSADRPPAAVTDGLLRLHEAVVVPDWIDYNGHMTEGRYLMVLADATDAFLVHVGVDAPYVDAGRSYYTVETHIRHLDEAHVGQGLYVLTRLLGHDAKRLHLFHELRRADDDRPLATGEHMLLHVDRAAQRTVPASAALLDALDAIAHAQHGLPRPEGAGSRIDGGRVSAG